MKKIDVVFGSNLAGRHGKGAAQEAVSRYGAIYGKAIGRQGKAYAIPTKDETLNTLPLAYIKNEVDIFLVYAHNNPDTSFLVTAIGCGLAGYSPENIRPLFANAPRNVFLSNELVKVSV